MKIKFNSSKPKFSGVKIKNINQPQRTVHKTLSTGPVLSAQDVTTNNGSGSVTHTGSDGSSTQPIEC